MKKTILSAVVLLAFSLLPATALAAPEPEAPVEAWEAEPTAGPEEADAGLHMDTMADADVDAGLDLAPSPDVDAGLDMDAMADADVDPAFDLPADPEPTPAPEQEPLSPGLETTAHPAYIRGSNDMFRPGGTLTRAEICSLVYSLLEAPPPEDGTDLSFTDVSPKAWYYKYVMPLAKMGAVEGFADGSFKPAKHVTRGELVQVLCRFFEKPEGPGLTFTDVPQDHPAYEAITKASAMGWLTGYADGSFRPDNTISRAEAVALVNRALGRRADQDLLDYDGKVFLYLDLPFNHWAYYDVMEASLPHTPDVFTQETAEGPRLLENWDYYTVPEAAHKPGYHLIDGELYCMGEDGQWARNQTIGVLRFNEKGMYTTGNAELDQRLTQLVKEKTVAGDSNLANFKRLHLNLCNNYTYRAGSYLKDGQTGWEPQMALEMLKNGKGNCYRFAGLETMMARKMGFQAKGMSGDVNTGNGYVPHGWCQVEQDGKTLMCDPELQYVRGDWDLFLKDYRLVYPRYMIQGKRL